MGDLAFSAGLQALFSHISITNAALALVQLPDAFDLLLGSLGTGPRLAAERSPRLSANEFLPLEMASASARWPASQ